MRMCGDISKQNAEDVSERRWGGDGSELNGSEIFFFFPSRNGTRPLNKRAYCRAASLGRDVPSRLIVFECQANGQRRSRTCGEAFAPFKASGLRREKILHSYWFPSVVSEILPHRNRFRTSRPHG